MNNNQAQVKVWGSRHKVTELQMAELRQEKELKEFKKCPANRCHPARCPQYEYCG